MEWTKGPIVGRGSSATVSVATNSSGELFAVKSTELSCSNMLQREYSLISQLNSPFLVNCFGFDITSEQNKTTYNMFMEYIPGGTLSDLIKKQGGSLNESVIKSYAHQILQGLDYLHSIGVVHCDIKGQNILIGQDGIKIADLGCGKFVRDENSANSGISGTPAFMAPEVARGEEQRFTADIWAFGCTIIEMATGSPPWTDMMDPVSALYRIGYSGDVPQFPNSLSNDAREFLAKCLIKDPKERWTAKQLLQHPFLQSLESNSWKVENLKRDSPTSILDQGFWNSFEVMESSSLESSITVDSPADRITRLIGDEGISCTLKPDWVEEEGWVTVRCCDTEESSIISEQNYELIQDFEELVDMETSVSTIFSDHEFVASLNFELLTLIDCINDEIISNFYTGSNRINLIISPESVGDVFVSEFNDSEIKKMKFYCPIEILLLFNFSYELQFHLLPLNVMGEMNSVPPYLREQYSSPILRAKMGEGWSFINPKVAPIMGKWGKIGDGL
ncbi:mitogen-activated protein kinase kinase kinase 2 [Nicotiana attenuata]|uniref:Mitogen-activated protein kinase kinase kinase 2 n=1 Tax=Nicotiana attenuata TaxID=49451 RepID=A0A314LB75_NICAT|nr:mitogen-activated protein kinase kinase kinase 2 [Nicotiana attenuata]